MVLWLNTLGRFSLASIFSQVLSVSKKESALIVGHQQIGQLMGLRYIFTQNQIKDIKY